MHLNKTFRKNIRRSISGSFGRYIAIIMIILLGVGFLSGLVLTNPVMLTVEKNFIIDSNFYDFRILSTTGFDAEEVAKLNQIENIQVAHGSVTKDFIASRDETDYVYRAHMILDDVNMVTLKEGRMPQCDYECVVDASINPRYEIGDTLSLSINNESATNELFTYPEYTVVGTCYSPIYMSVDRGTSSVGNGSLNGFVMIPEGGFTFDLYNEAYISVDTNFEPYTDEYDNYIDSVKSGIENASLDIINGRFNELYADAKKEIDDAIEKLDEESKKTQKELDDAKQKLDDGKVKLDESEAKLTSSKQKLDDAKLVLDETAGKLKKNAKSWDDALSYAKAELKAQKESYNKEVSAAEEKLGSAYEQLSALTPSLDGLKALIEAGIATPEQLATYQVLKENYDSGMEEYLSGKKALEAKKIEANKLFKSAENGIQQFEQGIGEYNSGLKKYNEGKKQLESAKEDYESALAEYNSGKADFEKEISDAQEKIDEASEELSQIENPKVFVLDRSYNTGYSTFQNDAAIVENIAMVLPIFFFLIAALVISTTMSRMVDDDRSLIGTMNAIGYGKREIYTKYILYSGSAALIGTVIGYFGLGYLFPQVIWIAYRMLYKIPGTVVIYDAGLFVLCLVIALLCSVGVTLVALHSQMKSTPAELIRPKAPPAGKRIFLERIGFIWSRLKFLHKVTMRNIFRFKKRMIMMILGIAGCTGLIITGFGIKDSVANICDYQYGDIMQYDISMQTTEPVDDSFMKQVKEACGDNLDIIASAVLGTVEVTGSEATKSVYVIATDQPELYQMIHLIDGERKVVVPEADEAVISNKLKTLAGIALGDEVDISLSDTERTKIEIVDSVENYVYNYIYMSRKSYENCFNKYEPKAIYIKLKDTTNDVELGAKLANLSGVSSVTVTSSFKSLIAKMMRSLNYVVLLVIISAAALAFVVLFNLGNINISERVKEIATIKVLGFHQSETGAYVFRENLILSLIGILLGIPVGIAFHHFVMTQIQVEMVSFKMVVKPISIVFAILLVILFTIATDLILRRKIRRIDMAESLKSVE